MVSLLLAAPASPQTVTRLPPAMPFLPPYLPSLPVPCNTHSPTQQVPADEVLDILTAVLTTPPPSPPACIPGTYTDTAASDDGSRRCIACTPGSYAANVGSKACKPCAAGRLAAAVGAAACRTCKPGTFSAADGRSCLACPEGGWCVAGLCATGGLLGWDCSDEWAAGFMGCLWPLAATALAGGTKETLLLACPPTCRPASLPACLLMCTLARLQAPLACCRVPGAWSSA